MCMKKFNDKNIFLIYKMIVIGVNFVKSTPLRTFHCILSIFCGYATDISTIYMKNFDAEISFSFELHSQFSVIAGHTLFPLFSISV